jgi:hypothetical protein
MNCIHRPSWFENCYLDVFFNTLDYALFVPNIVFFFHIFFHQKKSCPFQPYVCNLCTTSVQINSFCNCTCSSHNVTRIASVHKSDLMIYGS